jgi:hypothetical protein
MELCLINQIQKIALWVKEYKHPLKVIGGIFFVLALIAGFTWALGKEIEPIAFLFGLLSSLFLASPSVAEFLVPDRKPVRHMTYQEILDFILTTNAKEDWHGTSTSISSEHFLKEDPRLRFKARQTEEGIQNDDFRESWANSHPDSHATGYWHELYYDGDFIERFILVAVDGARAMLPPPDIKTKKIEPLNYRIAEIFDLLNTLDDYIHRSKLELSENVTKSISQAVLHTPTFEKKSPYRNNMKAELSLVEKIRNVFKSDPKPIFDHFRNIGIVAALALGAGALRSFNVENNLFYLNDIAWVCSFITFVIATILIIINISFAQISINLFFFNKTKFNGFFQKLGSAIPVYSYIGVLFALTVMYSFNTANDRIEKLKQQEFAAEKMYLNVEKVSETLKMFEVKIKQLESENVNLKEERNTILLEFSQFNKSIQLTAEAEAD